ncbi:Hpt domain-containing protein [Parathalassolituus penaei]|uniref:Hpt domain-containing protein n=1 Tax=Parathalassolituus penaei TaxID=2997323 RepID=A0A9X3IUD5_9GAMM|nr:Hpt domain-containing protein [Parathalassolituus penaei]MCY0966053.1 Hpt domain-containing protein [Parathalassolituus penaei]
MSSQEHFDNESLQTLQEIMEDEFNELIELFISDSGKRLPAMELAWETRNAVGLRMEAHSFKGSSANVCARELSRLNMELEDLLRDRTPDDSEWQELHNKINAIRAETGVVHDYFQQMLQA